MEGDENLWLTGSGKWDHKLRDPHRSEKASVQSPSPGLSISFLLALRRRRRRRLCRESRSNIHGKFVSTINYPSSFFRLWCYIALRRAIICQIRTLLKPASLGDYFSLQSSSGSSIRSRT